MKKEEDEEEVESNLISLPLPRLCYTIENHPHFDSIIDKLFYTLNCIPPEKKAFFLSKA